MTPEEAKAAVDLLSQRQLEVLILCCKGLSSTEIAQMTNGNVHTINDHKRVIFQKLDASSMIECAVIAAKAGIV